jgi:ArsR family transcriptional regulator
LKTIKKEVQVALKDLITIYKALSDETRLKILKLLEKGELCVCDIVSAFNTSQPKISFHLSTLKEAGLITDRKQGKWSYYSIVASDMFRRFIVLSSLERIEESDIEEELKRLEAFLQEKNNKKIVRICKC